MQSVRIKSGIAALALCLVGNAAFSQSILNQSKDDLLKDFAATSGGTSGAAHPQNGQFPPANSMGPRGFAPISTPIDPGNLSNPSNSSNSASPSVQYPGGYQFPASSKSMMQRLIEGAMSAVNVSNTNENGTNIKVPFVNVNVGGKEGKLRVKAPFMDLDSANGVNVKAPFVNINRGFNGNTCYPPVTTAPPLSTDPPLNNKGDNYSQSSPQTVPNLPASGN